MKINTKYQSSRPNEYEKDKTHNCNRGLGPKVTQKISSNWLKYTFIQMFKSQDRPCNETRGILCAKFVDVYKVMVHAKFQNSKPFGFKHKDF